MKMKTSISMELEAKEVLDVLHTQGFEVYFVGGCVRDALLQRTVKDIDIATSALPEQVMACFAKTAPTGLKHGTVTVIMNRHTFEVTTFRVESMYEQFRRPQEVHYITDLQEDLKRRDFTMNAMAIDRQGLVIDPFGGQKDLQDKVLRCVGKAEERFTEDALRMLRCIRFAAEYGQQIEGRTWEALLKQAPLLQHIAMERVRMELQRMIAGDGVHQAIQLLAASELWKYFKKNTGLPFELWTTDSFQRGTRTLAALQDADSRWAALLLMMNVHIEQAKKALRVLTFSKSEIDSISSILAFHDWLRLQMDEAAGENINSNPEVTKSIGHIWSVAVLERTWKLGVIKYSPVTAAAWMDIFSRTPMDSFEEDFSEPKYKVSLKSFMSSLQFHASQWLDEIPCVDIHGLAITGTDLFQLGQPPGPWIRELLELLLQKVALRELPNEKNTLIQAARELSHY